MKTYLKFISPAKGRGFYDILSTSGNLKKINGDYLWSNTSRTNLLPK